MDEGDHRFVSEADPDEIQLSTTIGRDRAARAVIEMSATRGMLIVSPTSQTGISRRRAARSALCSSTL